MKSIGLEETTLDRCVAEAQNEQIVITQRGKPVAFVFGAAHYDEEDFQYMTSPDFWHLIETRRQQPTITRAELERRLAERDARNGRS